MVIWVWLARLNIAPISKKPLLQLNFQMSKVFLHHPTMTNIPILKSLLGSCSWQSLIFRIPDNWHSFLGGFKYFLFLPLLGNDQPVFVWGFWGQLGQNRKYVKISFDFTQIHSFQPFQPYFSLGHPNLATGGVSRGLPMPKLQVVCIFWGEGFFVTQRWIQHVLNSWAVLNGGRMWQQMTNVPTEWRAKGRSKLRVEHSQPGIVFCLENAFNIPGHSNYLYTRHRILTGSISKQVNWWGVLEHRMYIDSRLRGSSNSLDMDKWKGDGYFVCWSLFFVQNIGHDVAFFVNCFDWGLFDYTPEV